MERARMSPAAQGGGSIFGPKMTPVETLPQGFPASAPVAPRPRSPVPESGGSARSVGKLGIL